MMKLAVPGQVLQGRCIAQRMAIVEAVAKVVGKCAKGCILLVAAGAGKLSVFAEAAIVKQFFTQRNALLKMEDEEH